MWTIFYCVALAVLVSLPALLKVPGTDQGVFLYVASAIAGGELLYVDVWDHKGPIFYVIETLGMVLSNGSYVGPALLQLLFLSGTFYLLHDTLRRPYGGRAAKSAIAVCAGLLVLMLRGGNLPAGFALLFMVAALWVFTHPSMEGQKKYLIIGLFAGASFFIKPTYLGLWAAMTVYMIAARRNHAVGFMIWAGGGFAAVALPIVLYFSANGALAALYESFWVFNIVHATEALGTNIPYGISQEFFRLYAFVRNIVVSPIVLLCTVGWGWLLFLYRQQATQRSPLLALALIVYPIELFLSHFSVYIPFYHYPIPLLPSITIGVAAIISNHDAVLNRSIILLKTHKRMLISVSFIAFLACSIVMGGRFQSAIQGYVYQWEDMNELVTTVQQYASKDDTIAVWGSRSIIYVLANRASASRYNFTSPIFQFDSDSTAAMMHTYEDDIATNKPAVIVDTTGEPIGSGLDATAPTHIQMMQRIIDADYQYVSSETQYDIYVRNDIL